MYIIAIAWLYVTLLMAFTEGSVVAGVLSFLFYGIAPTSLLWWLTGGRAQRRRRQSDAVPGDQLAGAPDGSDTQPDQ
jgi:hypothetical protein